MVKILTVLLATFVLQTSVNAADKIRIAFGDFSASFTSLALAEKRGFFKEEGLQAEIILIRGTAAVAALVNGEIDYYVLLAVTAAIQGLPVKLVACYVPSALTALIARPEFKSVQELKGKTIALGTPGGPLEAMAKLIFKHFGLDPDKDVKFLAAGANNARLAVVKQGLSAATLGAPPLDFLGKKMGFVVLARANELFSYPTGGITASVKKIKERPDEVKRVIKAGIKANRYIRENRDGTIQFLMEWLKIDKEMATATYESVSKAFNDDGSVPETGLRLVIEQAKKEAKVDREVALTEVADLSILKEAQKELGIKGK